MTLRSKIQSFDKKIIYFTQEYGEILLRLALSLVFFWFGFLKILGSSPANELVANTVYIFDSAWVVPTLGVWECLIAICIFFKKLNRIGFFLMGLQMIGTFLPLFLLPHISFTRIPYAPTLEGQYIIKNIVIITSAMILIGKMDSMKKSLWERTKYLFINK